MADVPLSEYYDYIDHQTVSKTDGWWQAVVLYENGGRREVAVYLWRDSGGDEGWKRKNKFSIKERDMWIKTSRAVDAMVERLD